MRRWLLMVLLAAAGPANGFAQGELRPIYIVNGVETDSAANIPERNIESVETLDADEEVVARYGERANNGVIIITLKYDTPARFSGGASFGEYIARRIKWPEYYPVARVVLRYTVDAGGRLSVGETLESTDARLRRKVLAAVKAAPQWSPATKKGTGVESEYVLSVQLPRGREMPAERYIRIL